MRDKNGVYCGDSLCRWWRGVKAVVDDECCGGKKVKRAKVDCGLFGVVKAEPVCNPTCTNRTIRS